MFAGLGRANTYLELDRRAKQSKPASLAGGGSRSGWPSCRFRWLRFLRCGRNLAERKLQPPRCAGSRQNLFLWEALGGWLGLARPADCFSVSASQRLGVSVTPTPERPFNPLSGGCDAAIAVSPNQFPLQLARGSSRIAMPTVASLFQRADRIRSARAARRIWPAQIGAERH